MSLVTYNTIKKNDCQIYSNMVTLVKTYSSFTLEALQNIIIYINTCNHVRQ